MCVFLFGNEEVRFLRSELIQPDAARRRFFSCFQYSAVVCSLTACRCKDGEREEVFYQAVDSVWGLFFFITVVCFATSCSSHQDCVNVGGCVVFRMPQMSKMEPSPFDTPASASKRLNYRFGGSFIHSESERQKSSLDDDVRGQNCRQACAKCLKIAPRAF